MTFLSPTSRFTLWCLLWLTFSSAAAPLLRPLTPDQGLSQGSVKDLLLDQDGFLWLATDGGLNRFDSHRNIQLSAIDNGLREISFSRVFRDSDNQIFAATASGQIYRYDTDTGHMVLFSQLRQQLPAMQYHDIVALSQLDADNLLVTTSSSLLSVSRHNGTVSKLLNLTDLAEPDGWFRDAIVFQHYILLAAHNKVIAYDINSASHYKLNHVDNTTASIDQQHTKVLSVQHDKLWIGTVEGLYSIALDAVIAFIQQQQPFKVSVEVSQRNIWQLLWQGDELIIPTEQGLFRYTPGNKQLVPLLQLTDSKLNLTDNTIIDIVADKEGGFWLASRDDGAFYWHPRSEAFSQISRAKADFSALSNERIYSIASSNNQLWLGTANGLNSVDLSAGTVRSYFVSDDLKAYRHEGSIDQIIPTDTGLFWLVTPNGLRLFDPVAAKILPLANVSEQQAELFDYYSYNYFAHQHNLYFFRQQKALRYNSHSGSVTDITDKLQSLGNIDELLIFAALPGENGALLVSKPDEVWLWQPDTGESRLLYRHSNYLSQSNRLADTAIVDRYNRLWVGISGIGLLGFATDTLQLTHQFPVGQSLLSDAVYDLQQDKYGDIWFSSHKGLGRLKPDSLKIEFFTRDDGLDTHEYNSGASLALADGTLVYGAMRGATLVNPALLQRQPSEPNIIITGIRVQSGELAELNSNLNNRHFTLSHRDLGITLEFSAMNFSSNHKVQYRYWLSSSDAIRYPLQKDNMVMFPQLAAGTHQFNVVSVSPQSGIESAPAKVILTVTPAPWLSHWALALYAAVVSLVLYRFYRFRRKQQLEISAAHDKAKQSAQRLKQALASVNSGAFEWKAENNSLFASRMHSMLGYSDNMNLLTLQQHISLIHPEDRDSFNSRWQRFMQDPQQGFDCTYRIKHKNDHWLWFRDQGKATSYNSANQPVHMIGTYSNITETRANQEKAKLFGEAFQQTRDWVVILDEQQRVLAANHSFCSAFGNMDNYQQQPRTHHLGISLVRRRFYTALLRDMSPGQHWQGEEMVITPDGRERPTLINISAIAEPEQPTFYVLVFTDITAQKLAEDELRYLANYDALTGLPNRALLMDRIYHGIDQAKRDKRSLALCFIDLDKFKQINDSLGHDIGDLLLKEIARRLTLTLRESDTVARLGGDEFVVLLEGYKTQDNISHVARKMLTVVSEPMQFGTHTVGVSPSIGIAVYPEDAINAAELLKHADVAMYHAKEAGRNNFQFFTAEMNEKAHMRLARETRLRNALKNNEFVNFYQPIVNSQTRQVVGAEVLMRWQSAEGLISPTEFIPLAEELRLIINMTNLMLERALQDLKHWHDNGHLIYLSVNISPQHLEQPSLAEHTRHLLKKYDIPANHLRFEVTENGLMRDHESAIETMLSLSFLGVQLALDDFGTGYSSLKYLKELPIDGIKIDRSFVKDIGIDSSDETIIEAMLSMANSLGMYCVAEGVETEQQLAFFSRRNCYLIQGYLFARPMPAAQLSDYLLQEH